MVDAVASARPAVIETLAQSSLGVQHHLVYHFVLHFLLLHELPRRQQSPLLVHLPKRQLLAYKTLLRPQTARLTPKSEELLAAVHLIAGLVLLFLSEAEGIVIVGGCSEASGYF